MHEQQKKPALEEDNVRNLDTKLGRMQRKRANRGGENGRGSVDVLGKSEAEVKTLEVEEMKMRSKVEKVEAEKRALEEEVVMRVREKATTERSTGCSSWTRMPA